MSEHSLAGLKIEKGLPIKERYPRNSFMTLAKEMEVGDSIFSPDDRVINGLLAALNKLHRSGETRADEDNGVEGRRLWRVKDRIKLPSNGNGKHDEDGDTKADKE